MWREPTKEEINLVKHKMCFPDIFLVRLLTTKNVTKETIFVRNILVEQKN